MDTGGDIEADDALRRSYDTLAEEYAQRIAGELKEKPLDRALLDAFAEMVHGQGPVADIGCGPGHVGRYLIDRGIPVTGIDLSPGMIAVAQGLHPMMTFTAGSMLDLPAPDASWAGITSFYSIIHLPPDSLPIAFGEFHRTLLPGGLLLVAFHVGDERIHEDELWGFDVDLDMYLLRREAIQRLIEQAGFSVLAHLERQPNAAVEYPSRRAYILARKGEPADARSRSEL
jgi:SAM-dependent methyltransferase